MNLQDPSEIKLKDGTNKMKWQIELIDNSIEGGVSIQLTLWGDDCYKQLHTGDVIAIKGAKLS